MGARRARKFRAAERLDGRRYFELWLTPHLARAVLDVMDSPEGKDLDPGEGRVFSHFWTVLRRLQKKPVGTRECFDVDVGEEMDRFIAFAQHAAMHGASWGRHIPGSVRGALFNRVHQLMLYRGESVVDALSRIRV